MHGSSPLVRGKLSEWVLGVSADGLIPAGAGKTTSVRCPINDDGAHPRWCGENPMIASTSPLRAGSSPLVRGKHLSSCTFRAS